MGVLLDTNVLIDYERGRLDFQVRIKGRESEACFLSVISASELLYGVHRAQSPEIRSKRLAFVEAILEAFPIVDIDLATARVHAELWSEFAHQGTMIGLHDSWLAATCLAHDLSLITGNVREFQRVPGLRLETWTRG